MSTEIEVSSVEDEGFYRRCEIYMRMISNIFQTCKDKLIKEGRGCPAYASGDIGYFRDFGFFIQYIDLVSNGYIDMEAIEKHEEIMPDLIARASIECLAKAISMFGLSPVEVIDLKTCDYGLYLKTDHWKSVRESTLHLFDHRCAVCNSDSQLDVHHRTYENRGNEKSSDTIVLCRTCHRIFHENRRLAPPQK